MSCVTEYLTVSEAAIRCAVSQRAIRRWLSPGVRGVRLRGEMMGGTWRIKAVDLDAFVAKCTTIAAGDSLPAVVGSGSTASRATAAREELRRRFGV